MEERIQVNGVWYVKETTPTSEIEIKDRDITFSMDRTWESRKWCFIATVIMRDEAETLDDYYQDPYIVITDKRSEDRNDWIEHDADNSTWMLGVYEGDQESMEEAVEMFDKQGLDEFRAFIGYLIKIGWLIKK
jgi:hypothetical protein